MIKIITICNDIFKYFTVNQVGIYKFAV